MTMVAWTKRRKPSFGYRRYNPRAWNRFGDQPALYLPNFGLGPGGKAQDYSPLTLNGSWSGTAPYYGPAPSGGIAALFNGTNNTIAFADNNALDFGTTQDFSILCRVRLKSTSVYNCIVDKRNTSGAGYLLGVRGDTQKINLFLSDGTHSVTVASATSLAANTDYDIAATVDRTGNGLIYINGKLDGTGAVTTVGNISNTNSLSVGNKAVGVTSVWTFLNGYIYYLVVFPALINVGGFTNRPWAMFERRRAVFGKAAAPGGGPPPFIIGGGMGSFMCAA